MPREVPFPGAVGVNPCCPRCDGPVQAHGTIHDGFWQCGSCAWRGATPAYVVPEPQPSIDAMVLADNKRMRAAGTKLAEAALQVCREYDGTHRLALAVAEWATAIAGEGGRSERYVL